MRIDTPSASIISSPADKKTILLDHLKKEAMVIPMPPATGTASSGSPKVPSGAAAAPPMQVQDLGKSRIKGHEVEGKRYVLPAATKASDAVHAENAEASSDAQASAVGASNCATQAATADGDRGLEQRQAENAGAD